MPVKMHMSYWFDLTVGDFLFKGYTLTTPSGFISTCFGLVSLAILFEGVKVYLLSVKQQHAPVLTATSIQDEDTCPNDRSSLIRDSQKSRKMTKRNVGIMLYEAMWYSIQNIMSYILMLAVMTFNGYFTISVCSGAVVGYFVFGNLLMEIGLRNTGIKQSQRDCPACAKEDTSQTPESNQQGSSIMTEVAQGLVQSVIMNSDVESSTDHCTSIVQVHQVEGS